jgi:serine/threonine-protein kinase RsbT
MAGESRVPINSDSDIVLARQRARAVADEIGFWGTDLVVIATAISELARNIVEYAGHGEIVIEPVQNGTRQGILVIAQDNGPGIADISLAMRPGYSTRQSLGMGLPGAKRLMDEFEIFSEVGRGTTVTLRKWIR